MFGLDNIFYHGIIRKYVIYFGTLFSDVWIQRDDKAGNIVQTLKVPINYGPSEKVLARLQGNPDLERPLAIVLPRMTFEISSITYDPIRKLGINNKPVAVASSVTYPNNPVPYNIGFRLSIMTSNVEDGTRIIEQILPAFTPEFNANLLLIPESNTRLNVPIILNDVSQTDTYEGSFENRRAIIWELDFTMRASFFGPTIDATDSLIKHIELNIGTLGVGIGIDQANTTNSPPDRTIELYPGLSHANTPINWEGAKDSPNHPTDYVDPYSVNPTDNYGFIIDFSENI